MSSNATLPFHSPFHCNSHSSTTINSINQIIIQHFMNTLPFPPFSSANSSVHFFPSTSSHSFYNYKLSSWTWYVLPYSFHRICWTLCVQRIHLVKSLRLNILNTEYLYRPHRDRRFIDDLDYCSTISLYLLLFVEIFFYYYWNYHHLNLLMLPSNIIKLW